MLPRQALQALQGLRGLGSFLKTFAPRAAEKVFKKGGKPRKPGKKPQRKSPTRPSMYRLQIPSGIPSAGAERSCEAGRGTR
jgi:hypothetical protein